MPTTPLWAPWRMPYIEASQSREKDRGCFFCQHSEDAARFRENLVLVVQPHAVALLNRFPFAPCHVLVAPRRHVPDLADLAEDEYQAVMALLRDATVRVRRAVSCPAMNVGFNLGLHAGAGHAEHCHGHIVPRWPGDTSFMPILADVRVMPEALDETWHKLHAAFGDVAGLRA